MFKQLAELPQSIDALIDGLIGFLYRILSTFAAVAFSPLYGAVRAHAVRGKYTRPASTLIVSTSLIAVSSVLGPRKIPSLLAENHHDILAWITYLLLLYLIFDCTILLCAAFFRRKRRYRDRTIAILRHSVAAMIAGWFVLAIVPQAITTVATAGVHNAVISKVSPSVYGQMRTILTYCTFLPVAGGAFILSWSASRSMWKRITYLATIGGILTLCAYATNKHSLPLIYAVARAAFPDKPPENVPQELPHQGTVPSPGDQKRPEGYSLRVEAVQCQISDSGQVRISAALLNDSDLPAALDTGRLQLSIARTDSNMLHPDFLDLPIHSTKDRIALLQPKSASSLVMVTTIPRTELPKLTKQCLLISSEGIRSRQRIFSDAGPIVPAGPRLPQ